MRELQLFRGRLGLLQVFDSEGGGGWRIIWAWILWGNVLRSVADESERGVGIRSNQLIGST